MSDIIKRELTSVSNWLGAIIMTVGDLLPYLTPDTLASLGFTAPWCQRISTFVGLLLIAYREKPKAIVLPPPTAEATQVPFVKPQSKESP
jgi:hypothetical protein